MASKAYVRSLALYGFSEFIQKCGGDPLELLRDMDIDPKLLRSQNQIYPYQKHIDLWEHAATVLDRPNIGLEYALEMNPHFPNVGPIFLLAQFEKTTGDWLQSAFRYLKYHTSAMQLSIDIIDDGKTVMGKRILDPMLKPGRQTDEMDSAIVFFITRHHAKLPEYRPFKVAFPHRAPEDTSLHREIFGDCMEFDAPFTYSLYPAEILKLPISSYMQIVRPAVHAFADMALKIYRLPKSDVVFKTRMAISMHLGSGRLNIVDVASTLEMHPKKLQRDLESCGETFSSLVETVRESLARNLLTSSNAPVAQIAGYLDYSNNTAFTLAFKRWTGMTPKKYRLAMAGKSDEID